MEAQAIATADYLDILFDNRNKHYGSYVLRKYQDKRMLRAFLLIVSFTLAFCIWTFIDTHRATANTVTVKYTDTMVYKPTIIEIPKQKPKATTAGRNGRHKTNY